MMYVWVCPRDVVLSLGDNVVIAKLITRKSTYLSSRKFVVTAKYAIVGTPPEGTSTFGSTRMSRKLKIGRGGTRPS